MLRLFLPVLRVILSVLLVLPTLALTRGVTLAAYYLLPPLMPTLTLDQRRVLNSLRRPILANLRRAYGISAPLMVTVVTIPNRRL